MGILHALAQSIGRCNNGQYLLDAMVDSQLGIRTFFHSPLATVPSSLETLLTGRADYVAVGTKECSLTYRESKATHSAQPLQHDRSKNYLIADGKPCDFLIEIGVMNQNGRVRASRYDKFRQINRFLELVDDVVKMLPDTRVLKIVDFGCGKSYLTFALNHLLTRIHNLEVEITGLDPTRSPSITSNTARMPSWGACLS